MRCLRNNILNAEILVNYSLEIHLRVKQSLMQPHLTHQHPSLFPRENQDGAMFTKHGCNIVMAARTNCAQVPKHNRTVAHALTH